MAIQKATYTWKGAKASDAIEAAVAKGLLFGAEHLLTVSNDRVPLDEGTLERSGTATVDPAKLEAAVSYDTHYAVEQHENLFYRHAPGRQAKYLEQSMNEEVHVIGAIVRRVTKRELS